MSRRTVEVQGVRLSTSQQFRNSKEVAELLRDAGYDVKLDDDTSELHTELDIQINLKDFGDLMRDQFHYDYQLLGFNRSHVVVVIGAYNEDR